MLQVHTIKILGFIHVAFTMDDYQDVHDVGVGLTYCSAVERCLLLNDKRVP